MKTRRKNEGMKAEGKNTSGPLLARVSVILLMMTALLGAGALSAVTAMRFAIQGTEVEVPDLAGTTESEARARVGEKGLELVVDSRRFSPVVPDGEVLEQIPRAGSRVKQSRSVRVRISLGERKFAVPDVRGASLRATQLQLVERGLTAGSTLYAHAPAGEPGTVLFQQPAPGDTQPDPAVNVLVSLGPVDQYFVMPVLTGRSLADARARVRDAGFRLSVISDQAQSGGPPGRVVTQQPPAGTRISGSDTIVLGVSQ